MLVYGPDWIRSISTDAWLPCHGFHTLGLCVRRLGWDRRALFISSPYLDLETYWFAVWLRKLFCWRKHSSWLSVFIQRLICNTNLSKLNLGPDSVEFAAAAMENNGAIVQIVAVAEVSPCTTQKRRKLEWLFRVPIKTNSGDTIALSMFLHPEHGPATKN
jgi:hypothetical protein